MIVLCCVVLMSVVVCGLYDCGVLTVVCVDLSHLLVCALGCVCLYFVFFVVY